MTTDNDLVARITALRDHLASMDSESGEASLLTETIQRLYQGPVAMNTEAPSIDLDELDRYARECFVIGAEAGLTADQLLALVAAAKAAQRVVGNPSRTPYTPPTSALANKEHAGPMNDLAEALQPFTVTKSRPEPEPDDSWPRRWASDDADEDLQSLMDRDMGDS